MHANDEPLKITWDGTIHIVEEWSVINGEFSCKLNSPDPDFDDALERNVMRNMLRPDIHVRFGQDGVRYLDSDKYKGGEHID